MWHAGPRAGLSPAPQTWRLVAHAHDVEWVDDHRRPCEWAGPTGARVGAHHRAAVALVGIDRDDLDPGEPPGGYAGWPGPQVSGAGKGETSGARPVQLQ